MSTHEMDLKSATSQAAIPYSLAHRAPLNGGRSVSPGAYARATRRRREALARRAGRPAITRLLSRVYRAVTCRDPSAGALPLRPGDILRDFPFYTQDAEVQYFSTHPNLLDDVFGVEHGQTLRFHNGSWSGRSAVVIGARGAELWVVLQGESYARRLPIPQCTVNQVQENQNSSHLAAEESSLSKTNNVFRRLVYYYGIELVHEIIEPREIGQDGPLPIGAVFSSATVFSLDAMAGVMQEVERLYTKAQCNFLQRAPDLFVIIEDLHCAPFLDEKNQHENELKSKTINEVSLTGESLYQIALENTAEAISTGSAPVILTPRVLVPSGTVGWAGEQTIFVNAGGLRHAEASLSASIAI